MKGFQAEKTLVRKFFAEMEAAPVDGVSEVLGRYTSDDYHLYGVYPYNELAGASEVAEQVWAPLKHSLARMQRREDVFMAGDSEIDGDRWVMSMGHFMGLFDADWLGIRATRKLAMLRYAEFNCVKGGKITRSGLWIDIIGFMQQVGVNPLPPSTGNYFVYPGPRNHDGILLDECPPEEATRTLEVLNLMIEDLSGLNVSGNDRCPPDLLAKRWSEDMVWYGPAGIGASYTIPRYQEQHQYPFREGLKDKVFNGHVCRFAEGNFACFFGWPNLSNTPTGGFLGLPGGELRGDMRVVDVYRREGGKLVENWVLIDIPYWLKQQGLDILERTRSIANP
ncbi:polyketide cyclase [Microbulbifer flavimaris]|uniref:Polyketide cyclase n=1 Tax=Microbulbifer flavimaris TaxID=1781068 RepID=A0ABX4I2I8_9GAMM|nr:MULTISPECIES: polyketide cyclase [Microbulbifer]KUJ84478.1 polyketide cyclase [Microbulbifer sp. ZGT114]PCO06566.1 polyketide cyclase [Microbulbifer flavimaris]